MDTKYSVCGFLYHKKSNSILLKKNTTGTLENFSIFEKTGLSGQHPKDAFHQSLQLTLGIPIAKHHIFDVYDYLSPSQEPTYVYYVEITTSKFPDIQKTSYSWHPFPSLGKLPMHTQDAHDATIGERVIHARATEELKKNKQSALIPQT